MHNYDLIVVGLGAMGSAALYQAAIRTTSVLGLDQFDPPHDLGSTHGETRITRLAVGEGAAYMPLVRRTHELWQTLAEASGEQLFWQTGGYIICPQTQSAHFHGAGDFVLKTARLGQDYGISTERVHSADLQARMPLLKVQPDEHAVFEPSAGIVAAETAVRVQLDLARRHGATVHTQEKVVGIQNEGSGVSVQTNRGRYRASRLILTVGPWIAEFMPPAYREPLAVYRQVFYWFEAENLARFRPQQFAWVIWIGAELSDFYAAFPAPNWGTPGVKMVTEQYLQTTHPDEVARTVKPNEIDRMANYFIRNKLHGVTDRCLKTQVCLYTVTPDEHFLIDRHPENGRILVASPCSGHGFKHSAAIGEALVQLALDGESALDLSFFKWERLQTTNERKR